MQDVNRGEVAPWVMCGHREGHSKAWPAVRMRGRGLDSNLFVTLPSPLDRAGWATLGHRFPKASTPGEGLPMPPTAPPSASDPQHPDPSTFLDQQAAILL